MSRVDAGTLYALDIEEIGGVGSESVGDGSSASGVSSNSGFVGSGSSLRGSVSMSKTSGNSVVGG